MAYGIGLSVVGKDGVSEKYAENSASIYRHTNAFFPFLCLMFLLSRYPDQHHQITFGQSVTGLAGYLDTDPDYLMMCFYLEARLHPSFQTSKHRGTGLIQLCTSDVYKLGITPHRLAALNGADQIGVLYKYFEPYKNRLNNLADVYFACFYPDGIGKSASYYFRFPTKYINANKLFPLRNHNRIQRWQIDKSLRDYFMRMGWEG